MSSSYTDQSIDLQSNLQSNMQRKMMIVNAWIALETAPTIYIPSFPSKSIEQLLYKRDIGCQCLKLF